MLGSVRIPGKAGLRRVAFLAELMVGAGFAPVLPPSQHAPTWVPVEVPHAAIVAVTCATADSCVAVGSYHEAGDHLRGLLATLWKGTWTAVLAPVPAGGSPDTGDSSLSDVACRGIGFCVAVGWDTGAGGDAHGLLETLSGGRWTATQAPLPAKVPSTAAASLSAVACPALRFCVAVGSYFDDQPSALGLVDTFSAGHWTASPPPAPPPNANAAPQVFLQTVTCPATDACVAIGSYVDAKGNLPGLIETLSHGSWTPTAVPRAAVFAVTCPAPGSCVAVGSTYGETGRLHGFIETLSRGTWSAPQAPLPENRARDPSPVLDAVTCPAVGSCVAIGAYTDTKLGHDDLIDVLHGSMWRPARVALPGEGGAHHDALTCLTPASCVAVGSYLDTGGTALHGLVETLSGATWTTWRAPCRPPPSDETQTRPSTT